MAAGPDETLGDYERAFIEIGSSFYMATVVEGGWPYIQRRRGPRGLLKVIDEKTFGFADLTGSKQYTSVGNLAFY